MLITQEKDTQMRMDSGESEEPRAPENDERRRAELRRRFMEIADRYMADLLRYARRFVGRNEDMAHDLVQEALLRGYTAFIGGQFQEGGNARAWLRRIVMNLFLNEYRRKVKWDAGVTVDTLTAGGETGPAVTHAVPDDTPGASLLAHTFDEPLERALSRLSEPLRMVILLVDVEEYSYEEAAQMLKIPVGTVRSRLSRARYQLQELLHAYAKDRRLI